MNPTKCIIEPEYPKHPTAVIISDYFYFPYKIDFGDSVDEVSLWLQLEAKKTIKDFIANNPPIKFISASCEQTYSCYEWDVTITFNANVKIEGEDLDTDITVLWNESGCSCNQFEEFTTYKIYPTGILAQNDKWYRV